MSECKNTEAKSQIERMLDIWESREVFHKHIISAMKYSLGEKIDVPVICSCEFKSLSLQIYYRSLISIVTRLAP